MPILRDIVLTFPWVKCKVHAEVLISGVKRRVCGLCDRLLETPDGLLVTDMEIQADAEEESKGNKNLLYPDMPANRITKAVVQCSCYGDLLEKSGMKVSDDVVIHIWCGRWTSYREPRIRGILDKVAETN